MENKNKDHALLSASSAERWINCPPSVRLTELMQDKNTEYAKEGTSAHLLCEAKLKTALGIPFNENMDNLPYYSNEMDECASGYASFVIKELEDLKKEGKHPELYIEQKVNFSNYVPEGYGTADALIVAEGILHIIDYKHGKGVFVNCKDNPQMMLYAIGGLNMFSYLFDIEKVQMTIYQPRLSNISSTTMDVNDLIKWANDVAKPSAELAYKGEGSQKVGKWCNFCKLKGTCKEQLRVNLELAKYEFKDPQLLTDDEIVDVLDKADQFVNWITAVKSYALQEALKGKKIKGYKVVEGRSNRKFTSEQDVIKATIDAGFDPYTKKLATITEMTARLGKERFNLILGKYIYKPKGMPTLVGENDSRQEMELFSEFRKEE